MRSSEVKTAEKRNKKRNKKRQNQSKLRRCSFHFKNANRRKIAAK